MICYGFSNADILTAMKTNCNIVKILLHQIEILIKKHLEKKR